VSDRAALLAAIKAFPDEDTPRLVFADWLDEHGENAHAALIRYSCSAAFGNRRTAEYRRALKIAQTLFPWPFGVHFAPRDRLDFENNDGENFDFIVGADPERRAARLLFDRGLVTEVKCTARQWREQIIPRLSGANAVRRVRLTTRGDESEDAALQGEWPLIKFERPPFYFRKVIVGNWTSCAHPVTGGVLPVAPAE
jgi:uncharacterized protein (TIGR02996 family)